MFFRLSLAAAFILCALFLTLHDVEAVPSTLGKDAKPQAILYITRTPSEQESRARDTRAKYEPPTGCYLGGYIEFDRSLKRKVLDFDRILRRDPTEFEERVSKPHAMYFFYVGYGRQAPLGWIRWLGAHNKFVHIALEPNDGLAKVNNDAYIQRFADALAKTGAKIFLRFGSEMNGEWTNYHNPTEFKKKFRLVHDVMKKRAPNVAMVWCPYATPIRNIPDYYPGDDATDWVGVNMYSVTYHDNSLQSPCEHEHTNDLLATVYKRYAGRKPMMICEFGATHYSDCEGRARPDFAMRKIATLYTALPRLFPRVKAINYFDLSADKVHNDYSVTDDPNVLAVYRYAISSPYFLSVPLSDRKQQSAQAIPMPVRKGELLRGKVALSCFARAPSDILAVRYKVDNYLIYQSRSPLDWSCTWDAGSVRPGRHTLSLEVLNARNAVVAAQRLSIVTGH